MEKLWRRWILGPVRELLGAGLTPEKLAWSLAAGVVIGSNPLLVLTTILALSIAAVFRLNQVASQLSIHVMYPLQLVLFPVFIKLGSLLFATDGLPIEGKDLWWAAQHHPLATTRLLWMWELHALVVWASFATVAVPLLAFTFTPGLEKLCDRVSRRLPAQAEFSA